MAELDGLEGLAAIEDFAVGRPPDLRGSTGQGGLDWAAVKRAYMSSAYIARFMDESGLTQLMDSHLAAASE
jgi:hypothetical protein